jgi:hypothetical protein
VHGLRGAVAGRRAAQWLERFGIGGYARTPLSRLSKRSPAGSPAGGRIWLEHDISFTGFPQMGFLVSRA